MVAHSSLLDEKKTKSNETLEEASEGILLCAPTQTSTELSGEMRYDQMYIELKGNLPLLQEFRKKGYNLKVPEVDGSLLAKLHDALERNKPVFARISAREPFDPNWVRAQFSKIAGYSHLIAVNHEKWVSQVLELKSEGSLGRRATAQSFVRRLEAVIKILTEVVNTLGSVVDGHSMAEKRCEILVRELMTIFTSVKEGELVHALNGVLAEEGENAPLRTFLRNTAVAPMITITALRKVIIKESDKDWNEAHKLWNLQWNEQQNEIHVVKDFFFDIADYLRTLSGEMTNKLIENQQLSSTSSWGAGVNAALKLGRDFIETMKEYSGTYTPGAAPDGSPTVNAGLLPLGINVTEPAKNDQSDGVSTGPSKIRLSLAIGKKYLEKTRHNRDDVFKTPEQIAVDSITRSILWRWQHPVVQIQYVGAKLLSKVKELENMDGGMFITDESTLGDEHASDNSHLDLSAQIRQAIFDKADQANPERQRKEKLTVLNALLDSDIDSARAVLERMKCQVNQVPGAKGYIQPWLESQQKSVLNISTGKHSALPGQVVMTKIAEYLTDAAFALDEALAAAKKRDFTLARRQLEALQRLVTLATITISQTSIHRTGKDLDEASRGSRIAKYLACTLKEQNPSTPLPTGPEQVHSLLKNHGLLEGILSDGDPEGYLLATRVAGESDNANNDALRLLMSPEQYTALEKDFVEYVVKWGQKRVSRGGAKLVVELAFDAASSSIKLGFNLVRLPYKLTKGLIKTASKIYKLNKYIMPGYDKSYKAIYSMLMKKLTQLAFDLISSPVPGVLKLGIGAVISSGAGAYNLSQDKNERTLNSTHGRMVEGQGSRKVNMSSAKGMMIDFLVDTSFGSVYKGVDKVINADKYQFREFIEKYPTVLEIRSQASVNEEGREYTGVADDDFDGEEYENEQINLADKSDQNEHNQSRIKRAITLKDHRIHVSRDKPDFSISKSVSFPWLTPDETKGRERAQCQAMVMRRLLRLAREKGVTTKTLLQDELRRRGTRIQELKREQNQIRERTREYKMKWPSTYKLIRFMEKQNEQIMRLGKDLVEEQDKIYDAEEIQRLLNDPQPRRFNFESKMYQDLSEDEKDTAYVYAMKNILRKIEADTSLPLLVRINAGLALEGENVLVPVDIYWRPLNNAFFLPDEPGSKYGILIRLDSENPYTRIQNARDVPKDLKKDMPKNSDKREPDTDILPGQSIVMVPHHREITAMEALEKIQPPQDGGFMADSGERWYEKYFNSSDQKPMDVTNVAARLRRKTEFDYKSNGGFLTNELLMQRAKDDIKIFDPFERTAVINYSRLDASDVVKPGRGFARAGQKIISDWKGETVRELISNLKLAEQVGEFIDIGLSMSLSFIPGGQFINIGQAIVSITDKIKKGDKLDPLETAGLIFGLLTLGKADVKIGRLNPRLGRGTTIFFTIAGRVMDAEQFRRSVELAVRTGEPLAIYQALRDAGMGINDAYAATKNMSSNLVGVKKIEDVASLKMIEKQEVNEGVYLPGSSLKERTFKVGNRELLGRINNGALEVRSRSGEWKKQNSFYLLMYRLQNAGGEPSTSFSKRERIKKEMDDAQEALNMQRALVSRLESEGKKGYALRREIDKISNLEKNLNTKKLLWDNENKAPEQKAPDAISEVKNKLTGGGKAELREWISQRKEYNVLNSEVKSNIGLYTGGSYRKANWALREGDLYTKNDPVSNSKKETIRKVKDGLSYLPDCPGEVYRGSVMSTDILNKIKVGDVVFDPGFLSTSVDKQKALSFAKGATNDQTNYFMVIQGRHGKAVMHKDLTQYMDEAEVTFFPRTPLKITGIKHVKEKQGFVCHISLEEVEFIEGAATNIFSGVQEAINKDN
ncbi:ADP-ribosyltransferase [Enterobacter kobei]|uniref:ADP-ribosyltransferase n=1 Tax=Enterobacter kobei TaxID=208224 RepID=UPI003CEA74A0